MIQISGELHDVVRCIEIAWRGVLLGVLRRVLRGVLCGVLGRMLRKVPSVMWRAVIIPLSPGTEEE